MNGGRVLRLYGTSGLLCLIFPIDPGYRGDVRRLEMFQAPVIHVGCFTHSRPVIHAFLMREGGHLLFVSLGVCP